jgi:hypothetical protein
MLELELSWMYGVMSFAVTTTSFDIPFSKAHSFFAACIWRMLLMQALAREVRGSRIVFGIMIRLKRPAKKQTITIAMAKFGAESGLFELIILINTGSPAELL